MSQLALLLLGLLGAPSGPVKHWAFERVSRPAVPQVKDGAWVENPIDAFIAREHEKLGLAPSPPARKDILFRRVTLDLTGLPPAPEELHEFLADTAADAYERAVDRLLSSPRHGERWGRHWMDVWRYSDWYGRRAVPDVMNSYPRIWRWRDWVVRSLNDDRGYDRMVLEMLAADEVAPEDDAALPATGFIVRNWYKWNYNVWMKDLVEHTGKAFLGLTLNCAHCHDHKYDPITQEEYFKFRAFFEPLELRHDRVPGEPDPGPFKKYVYAESYGPIASGMIRVFDEKLDAQTFMYSGGDARNRIEGRPPIAPGVPAALGGAGLEIQPLELPPRAYYPGLKPFVEEETIAQCEREVKTSETELAVPVQALAALEERVKSAAGGTQQPGEAEVGAARAAVQLAGARLSSSRARLESARARVAADRARYAPAPESSAGDLAGLASRAERVAALRAAEEELVRAEQGLAAAAKAAAADAKGADAAGKAQSRVGECRSAVEKAQAALQKPGADYTPLGPVYPPRSTGRRRALASWIASRENPLTARVAVNHIWMRHFQRPLVESVFDFGLNGKRPSHPELLDWLAAELMDSGWSMKAIHRLLVTSSAYRMSSAAVAGSPAAAIDPDNHWLWRANTWRLEAEGVRDSLLSVARELDLALGGPEVDPKDALASRKRSIYLTHHGEETMQLLEIFDAANPGDCYRRTSSIAPQQALALENSELSLAQARLLARRLGSAPSAAAFIESAFETVLSRPPSPEEAMVSERFLEGQSRLLRGEDLKPPEAPPGGVVPSADPELRARECLVHALLNHNDFVTVR